MLALLATACGEASAPPGPAAPSPTIAAAVRSTAPARPSPTPANPAAQASPSPAGSAGQPTDAPAQQAFATAVAGEAPAPEPTIYLWPAALPPDLKVAPKESRVSADGEVGPNGLGFYIVTLNAGDKKMVIGGGDLGEA